jgi:hypothetical protein
MPVAAKDSLLGMYGETVVLHPDQPAAIAEITSSGE